MNELSCKLLVIGGGPGGYVCAINAAKAGVDTMIVDAAEWGGTCLKVGCIPSKALIEAAEIHHNISMLCEQPQNFGISVAKPQLDLRKTMAWKNGIVSRLSAGVAGLLKKAGVRTIFGHARFCDGRHVEIESETGLHRVTAENIVIATGSVPASLPNLPFGGSVLSSTDILSLEDIPQSLAVVGGGYIGMELGMAFAKMGASVTVVEAGEAFLPVYDKELTQPVAKNAAELGMKILTTTKAKALSPDGKHLQVSDATGQPLLIAAEKILVTIGRKPQLDGWGREELVLDMEGSFIRIDDQCRTSMSGIYAIGDVTGEPMLAHRAMAQGAIVAEIIGGKKRRFDPAAIPAVCFTDPEIVAVGLLPHQAQERGQVLVGSFPFRANGRALTKHADEGFIRIVARADDHLVLGIQAVGSGVSELSAGFALALEMGACLEDIAGTIHAHPTMSEALHEAALAALGKAVHI